MKLYLILLIGLLFNQLLLAQIPAINTFSPASGPVGTTVTITGNNFSATTANNIVFFGAVRATVITAASTSLTVMVPAGATYQPITVTTNSLTAYSAMPFTVTFSGGGNGFTASSFAPKIDYASGKGPACIASADFDGDGKPDLVAVNDTANTFSVFRNLSTTGTISLSPKIDFITGNKPYSVTCGDLDGDGKPDIAVANGAGNTVSIFRNASTGAGDISFTSKIDLPSGTFPFCVVICDFDGDGKPDLASTSSNNTVSIFKNNSNPGAFSFSPKADFVTGVSPYWIAVGDFDGDGKPELATANGINLNWVSVLRNTSTSGNISFAPKVDFDGGAYAFSIMTGDINGDGKLDLTVVGENSGYVSVMLNRSNGAGNISFAPQSNFSAGGSSFGVSLADMDGDGKPDIVAANSSLNSVAVLKNSSLLNSSGFDQQKVYGVGTNPWVSALVDLDGDGKPDIATANERSANISVVLNKLGDLRLYSFDPVSGGNGSIVNIYGDNFYNITGVYFGNIPAASFNVISATKIIATVSSGSSGKVSVRGGNGIDSLDGFNFNPAPVITSFYPAFGGTGTFVNIFGINLNNVTTVRFGNSIASSFTINSPTSMSAIVGAVDSLFMAVKVENSAAIASANGFYSGPSISSFSPKTGPAGTLVTISGHHFNNSVSNNIVLFGAAKATVVSATSTSLKVLAPANATFEPISIVADSLIAYSQEAFSITFPLINTGFDANSLILNGDSATGQYPISIAKADFDQDGKTDLVILNNLSASFSILKNTSQTGYISFKPKVDFSTFLYPYKVITGDVNADGKTDVIVLNNYGNFFSIFKNTTTNGVISFAPAVIILSLNPAINILITDIDIDGKPDIVLLEEGNSKISVFKNTSVQNNIAFRSLVDFYSPDGNSIASGDMDNDGKPEIIISGNNESFTVFKNKSVAGEAFSPLMFDKSVIVSQGKPGQDIAVADFERSGTLDVAIANKGTRSITVNTNSSTYQNILFSNKQEYPFVDNSGNPNQLSILVADMDGDGLPDIVFPGFSNNNFVLKNVSSQNNSSFLKPLSCFAGYLNSFYGQLTIADLDGDGKPDIASIDHATNRVYFLRNRAGEPISMCNGGNMILNTNLSGTNYQWQLNTGNGFNNIVADANFSNTNSANLGLRNIPSSWYGNEYRCIVDGNIDVAVSLIFSNYWIGFASSDWNDPTNWSCSKIPDINSDVIINSGTIVINSNVTIRSLKVNPGATVTVNAGFKLTVLH